MRHVAVAIEEVGIVAQVVQNRLRREILLTRADCGLVDKLICLLLGILLYLRPSVLEPILGDVSVSTGKNGAMFSR